MTNENQTDNLPTADLDPTAEAETVDLKDTRASGLLGFVAALAIFGLAVVLATGCGGAPEDDGVRKPGTYSKTAVFDERVRDVAPEPGEDDQLAWLFAVFGLTCNVAEFPNAYEDRAAIVAGWAAYRGEAERFVGVEPGDDLFPCDLDLAFMECVAFDEGCEDGLASTCSIRANERFPNAEGCYE